MAYIFGITKEGCQFCRKQWRNYGHTRLSYWEGNISGEIQLNWFTCGPSVPWKVKWAVEWVKSAWCSTERHIRTTNDFLCLCNEQHCQWRDTTHGNRGGGNGRWRKKGTGRGLWTANPCKHLRECKLEHTSFELGLRIMKSWSQIPLGSCQSCNFLQLYNPLRFMHSFNSDIFNFNCSIVEAEHSAVWAVSCEIPPFFLGRSLSLFVQDFGHWAS